MTLIFPGKTKCPICGRAIEADEEVVSFPAFLPGDHALSRFSDAAFHARCFNDAPEHAAVEALYKRYRAIWDSRPQNLTSVEEIERWGREAFKNFPE